MIHIVMLMLVKLHHMHSFHLNLNIVVVMQHIGFVQEKYFQEDELHITHVQRYQY